MKIASFFFLVLFVITSPASAQSRKPSSIAELAVYRGPDREQILYAGAKAEGKIIWYTSLAGDSYKEMVKAFETRYSGVKVESYRAAASARRIAGAPSPAGALITSTFGASRPRTVPPLAPVP